MCHAFPQYNFSCYNRHKNIKSCGSDRLRSLNGGSHLSLKRELLSWVKTILVAVVIVFLIRTFLFTNYIVEGESMLPTMSNGDRLIVSKIGYKLSEPERFDLIVFHAGWQLDYIKRVIGLPGDHIEYRDDVLYVNGEKVEEPFLQPYLHMLEENQRFTENFTLEDMIGEQYVPEDSVFVLGDNRRNSSDSRMLGVISYSDIVGEVKVKYWPLRDFEYYK